MLAVIGVVMLVKALPSLSRTGRVITVLLMLAAIAYGLGKLDLSGLTSIQDLERDKPQ